jgi:hypothetical protein
MGFASTFYSAKDRARGCKEVRAAQKKVRGGHLARLLGQPAAAC